MVELRFRTFAWKQNTASETKHSHKLNATETKTVGMYISTVLGSYACRIFSLAHIEPLCLT